MSRKFLIIIKQNICWKKWHDDNLNFVFVTAAMASSQEEDLYFEMEFESKKDEEDGQSYYDSKSVESLSDCSQLSSTPRYEADQRRGSSVGPILERPKYLRYE